jgi:two-component system sensor kinase FixL
VADSGIGIPEDLGKSVFEPFFSTKPGGLGLGLSISRSLVEAHRGELYYRANATGGTTFFLRLPRIAPQVGRT